MQGLRLTTALLALAVAVPAGAAQPVTVETFKRAESHDYFRKANAEGCFAKLCHRRQTAPADKQTVIRMNRDTLYSQGVFDLTTPVTITLPDPGKRFMSLMLVNEDHYVPLVHYGAGAVTLTQDLAGSRYAMVLVRTFADPNDAKDLAVTHALQDKIQVAQASAGTLTLPDWDDKQRAALHDALLALTPFAPEPAGRFGRKEEVDPVRHLIFTSAGWGGNPLKDASYVSGGVPNNDGTQAYTLTLQSVPVDGFWSVTVYNAKGFYEAPESAASLNNVTAKPNKDGSTTVRFGGDPRADNYLRIMPGWSYVLRLYRPRAEALDGRWQAPVAVAVP